MRPGISDPSSIRLISLDEAVGHDDPEGAYERNILGEKNRMLRGIRSQPVDAYGRAAAVDNHLLRGPEDLGRFRRRPITPGVRSMLKESAT